MDEGNNHIWDSAICLHGARRPKLIHSGLAPEWSTTASRMKEGNNMARDAEKAVRPLKQYQAIERNPAFVREDGTVVSALWTVIDKPSQVILAWGERDAMETKAQRWNDGAAMPEAIRDKRDAARELKKILKPGATVHTILRHVSRSGMMRHISVVYKGQDITWYVARLMDDRRADDGGIKCGGCGMDMGFNLVYNLGRTLWPLGFKCAGQKCPSNEHSGSGSSTREMFKGQMHKGDGGYALHQVWL